MTDGNKSGNQSLEQRIVAVADTIPPQFELSLSPDQLWPPNHRLVEITPKFVVLDKCDKNPVISLIGITASEGDNARGDGNTTGDVVVAPDGRIFLRAERSGKGPGRVYTVKFRATDASGNSTDSSAQVSVSHNR